MEYDLFSFETNPVFSQNKEDNHSTSVTAESRIIYTPSTPSPVPHLSICRKRGHCKLLIPIKTNEAA